MPNELVPLTEGVALADVGPRKCLSTYQWDRGDETRKHLRAMMGKDAILSDLIGGVLEVQHIVVFWGQYSAGEDGNVQEGPMVTFVGPDGKRVRTSSMTALKAALVPAEWGLATLPYSPPQRFKVIQQPSRNPGHKYLDLEWEGC